MTLDNDDADDSNHDNDDNNDYEWLWAVCMLVFHIYFTNF